MKQIKIADATLCRENSHFSFKEKIEIARQLENLNVDVIEFPEIANARADILLIKTVSSFVKNSVISVAAGVGADSVENAIASLANVEKVEFISSSEGLDTVTSTMLEGQQEYFSFLNDEYLNLLSFLLYPAPY